MVVGSGLIGPVRCSRRSRGDKTSISVQHECGWLLLGNDQSEVVAEIARVWPVMEGHRLARLQHGEERLHETGNAIEQRRRRRAARTVCGRFVPEDVEHEDVPA